MGIFDFLKWPDINEGVKEYERTPHALLLDVRTAQEYSEGHIPASKNLPLQAIDKAPSMIDNKDIPLFVYCYSGARSRQAAQALTRMGYAHVKNLGGISAYKGKVER